MKDTLRIAYFPSTDSFYAVEEIIRAIEKENEAGERKVYLIILSNNKVSAQIATRLNGFTFIDSEYDMKNDRLKIIKRTSYSNKRSQYSCYAESTMDGQRKILESENIDLIIAESLWDLKVYKEEKMTTEDFLKRISTLR